MKIRLVSVLMLFAMLAALLASCGDEAPKTDAAETAADTTTAEETEEIVTLSSNVPPDTDLNGLTISLLHSTDVMFTAEDDGDIVNSAIISRNMGVEEKLNCKFETTSHTWDLAPLIQAQILAGDTSYNLYAGMQYVLAPLVLENSFIKSSGCGDGFFIRLVGDRLYQRSRSRQRRAVPLRR